jgi:vancomycin resistance protein YoaR
MKRFLFGALVALAGGGVAMVLMATRYESKIRPNTRVGVVEVGGMVPADAAKKLRVWWETEKLREVSLSVANGRKAPWSVQLAKLVRLDDQASVGNLHMEDFWVSAARTVGQGAAEPQRFEPRFVLHPEIESQVESYVRQSIGEPRPARVRFVNGQIVREPEVSGYSLDREAFGPAVMQGIQGTGAIAVPIQEAPKTIPDEELAKISEVVSSFSTTFPRSQTSRNTNLRIASGRIDGTILMPGEVFSFNEVVGKRTVKDGYRIAGVYRNGRHDVALAGGICQVSGTLYNAALLANLKIVQRQNHSMPVAYLPVGRDATVDYGTIDFKFQNSTDAPIAIYSTYESGRLSFGVLGKKEPGLSVKLVTANHKSWSRGVKYVEDRSLPPGKTKVIEKGSAGHQIDVYRVVMKNGVEVNREYLGRSRYGGGVKIIARGAAAPPADAAPAPPPAEDGQPSSD